jgi:hypothetical protein
MTKYEAQCGTREAVAGNRLGLKNEPEDLTMEQINTNQEEAVDNGYEQAKAQMSYINNCVAALGCDYDRLAELKSSEKSDKENDELNDLETAAGEYESREDAERAIYETPLSIEVRSDWQNIGEELVATNFTILLCTGGPACRIVGELDDKNTRTGSNPGLNIMAKMHAEKHC